MTPGLSPPPSGTATASSPPPPPPPTARKMFTGLPAPALHKKLRHEQLRVDIKREMMVTAGGGGGGGGGTGGILPGEPPVPPPSEPSWAAASAREEMAPLNLSSRADPVRDIRCEFCSNVGG
ncbi:protein Wiz-like [Malurus melanocephalus]|uniref:protein Wiz-like n=1 Tax=Malurus melanocephalus TaxID=175006 RepID=UPI0025496447|nr:protein Wiz-like [Malurus melanocephalus]